jgi:hypothetical protein
VGVGAGVGGVVVGGAAGAQAANTSDSAIKQLTTSQRSFLVMYLPSRFISLHLFLNSRIICRF